MWSFIHKALEQRIEQIRESETTKPKETDASKNDDVLIVNEEYLKILNSSFELLLLYEEFDNKSDNKSDNKLDNKSDNKLDNKISKKIQEMISEGKFETNNLFKNYVIYSTEIQPDNILALAIAYFNLGRIYSFKQFNLEAAKYHLIKCIELLKGKELHYKVILTAIQARLVLYLIYKELEQFEKCYLLLDEALELYLNYTKDENEYPVPFYIDILYGTNEETNSKIFLTKQHMLTLMYMDHLYKHESINMHKFVMYVHNLLNKQLEIMENSTENDMFVYWAEASTKLSLYFLYHDRFMEAKIHLKAATYMWMMYYVSALIEQGYSDDSETFLQLCSTNITEVCIIYTIMILRSSIERLIQCKSNKSCEANNVESESHPKSEEELMKPLTFVDLEKDLENINNYHITDTYVSNLKDVKIIFANLFTWFNAIYIFCKENKHFPGEDRFMSQLQIILYTSEAYKYYVYFEGNKSKQIKVIEQQAKMLEKFITILSSECRTSLNNHYLTKLNFELGMTYIMLLNKMCELNEIEKIIDEMETRRLVENIIQNFNLCLKSVSK